MNASHEQDEFLVSQFGIALEEVLNLKLWISLRCGGTETDNDLVALVQPKGGPSQQAFLFASKEHRLCVAEHPVLCPRPVQPFLQVFEGIPSLEPWIKHSVRVQNVGRIRFAKSAPCTEAVKLPKSIHNNGVVSSAVRTKPWNKLGAKAVTIGGLPQGMHGEYTLMQERCIRSV